MQRKTTVKISELPLMQKTVSFEDMSKLFGGCRGTDTAYYGYDPSECKDLC